MEALRGKRVWIAGERGMVGSAVKRALQNEGVATIDSPPRAELDLTDVPATRDFIASNRPDSIVVAAAKVGGIVANDTYPVDFLRDNLLMQLSIIEQAHQADINQVLFLGSSCIYPRDAAQPLTEEALLTGSLEPTNEPYAIAKIAGIKLCESYARQYDRDYRSLMPTNLYGPGDNFHPQNSHVIPALLRRFHEAQRDNVPAVTVWGSGNPMREFLHVDDLADACVFSLGLPAETWSAECPKRCSHVNVGTGKDCTIRELAETIAKVTGYRGDILWDTSKPDGTPRKLLDVSRMNRMGWKASTSLDAGLAETYDWFKAHIASCGTEGIRGY